LFRVVPITASTVVVAIDVAKTEFAFSVTDVTRTPLPKPHTGCPMTGPSLVRVVADVGQVLPVDAVVEVGIEAAGHYHRPLLNAAWPVGWEVLELNPGQLELAFLGQDFGADCSTRPHGSRAGGRAPLASGSRPFLAARCANLPKR
jgi:hypothetical protein